MLQHEEPYIDHQANGQSNMGRDVKRMQEVTIDIWHKHETDNQHVRSGEIQLNQIDPLMIQTIEKIFPKAGGLKFLAAVLRHAAIMQNVLPGMTQLGSHVAVINVRTVRDLAAKINWGYDTTHKYEVIFCALNFLHKRRDKKQLQLIFPIEHYVAPESLDELDRLIAHSRPKVQQFAKRVRERLLLTTVLGQPSDKQTYGVIEKQTSDEAVLLKKLLAVLQSEGISPIHGQRIALKISSEILSQILSPGQREVPTNKPAHQLSSPRQGHTTWSRNAVNAPTSTIRQIRQKQHSQYLQPQVTGYESTQPQVTGYESTQPQVTGYESTQPQTTGYESTQPQTTGYESTQPQTTGYESTQPQATGYESTQPQAADYESTYSPFNENQRTYSLNYATGCTIGEIYNKTAHRDDSPETILERAKRNNISALGLEILRKSLQRNAEYKKREEHCTPRREKSSPHQEQYEILPYTQEEQVYPKNGRVDQNIRRRYSIARQEDFSHPTFEPNIDQMPESLPYQPQQEDFLTAQPVCVDSVDFSVQKVSPIDAVIQEYQDQERKKYTSRVPKTVDSFSEYPELRNVTYNNTIKNIIYTLHQNVTLRKETLGTFFSIIFDHEFTQTKWYDDCITQSTAEVLTQVFLEILISLHEKSARTIRKPGGMFIKRCKEYSKCPPVKHPKLDQYAEMTYNDLISLLEDHFLFHSDQRLLQA
ncbi:DUF1720 domain-containing protein [Tengunoibacter tsumagoiensis]|uniref:DUF1720 domain-containing protein n=1 Tax=Tengunoibacter tsumagoiensis TaxID=2014871 RepID=A0A402A5Q4_9CHLR|nr:DUF1720 domain-containing protein [Tengunoibacter tsumagoiensis]GCE14458.1 hypothetical protein KTT_43170 [Tengunoibacter tsumagoiensis]